MTRVPYITQADLTSRPLRKRCVRCHGVKFLAEFYRNVEMADGLARWCRRCDRRHLVNRGQPEKPMPDFPAVTDPRKCGDCGERLLDGMNRDGYATTECACGTFRVPRRLATAADSPTKGWAHRAGGSGA